VRRATSLQLTADGRRAAIAREETPA